MKFMRYLVLLAAIVGFSLILPRTHGLRLQQGTQPAASPGQQLIQQSREAAGEEGSAQFKHSPPVQWISRTTGLSLETSYLLGMGINFAIIAGFIIWVSKKNLPGVFRNRTVMIQKSMEEARKASADANRRLAEIESRLAKLDHEIAEMRAAAEKEAVAEEERIKAAAEEDARKIMDSLAQEIEAAGRSARRELTAYAADLAVSIAKQQLHVDAPTDQTLVRHFAQQLTNGGKRKDNA